MSIFGPTPEAIDASVRAVRAWNRILRDPLSVEFEVPRVVNPDGTVVNETTLAPQTVRIVSDNRASVLEGIAGITPTRDVIVYGIQSHPTEPDTIMEEGYSFVYDDDTYFITDVLSVPGERHGIASVGLPD